jgi:uncharacterized membrane protein YqjE
MFNFQLTFLQRSLLSSFINRLPLFIVSIGAPILTLGIVVIILWFGGLRAALIMACLLLLILVGAYATTWWKFLHTRRQQPAAHQRGELAAIQELFEIEEDEGGFGEVADVGEPAHQVGVLNEV